MKVTKGGARAFLDRLGELIQTDEGGPDIVIATDAMIAVGEDGRREEITAGAEAVLIIHGAPESRSIALAKLLALIDTQQK